MCESRALKIAFLVDGWVLKSTKHLYQKLVTNANHEFVPIYSRRSELIYLYTRAETLWHIIEKIEHQVDVATHFAKSDIINCLQEAIIYYYENKEQS